MARTKKQAGVIRPVQVATTVSVVTVTKTLVAVAVAVGAIAAISAFGLVAAGSVKALIQTSLKVAVVANTPSVTMVQSPMRDVKLGDWRVLRLGSSPVVITQVTFGLQTDLATSEITNFRLVTPTNQVLAGPVATYDDYHDTVTFNFARPLPVQRLATARVIADVAPISGQRSVRVGLIPSQQVKAFTSDGRVVPVTPATPVAARKVTVTPAIVRGTLDINGTVEGYGIVGYDPQLLGGMDSQAMGALEFSAQNEPVTVKKLALYVEDNPNVAQSMVEAYIWKPEGGKYATSQSFQVGDWDGDDDTDDVLVVFDQLSYGVQPNNLQALLVGFTARHMGNGPEDTAKSGENINWQIAGPQLVVVGNNSGQVLSLTGSPNPNPTNAESEYDLGFTSRSTWLYGVKAETVINDLSNGQLLNGDQTIGRFRFLVTTNGNANPLGQPAAFNLQNVKFELLYNGIDLNGTVPGAEDLRFFWATDPSTVAVITNLGDGTSSVLADLNSLGSQTDISTLVIDAPQISGVDQPGDYLQMKLPLTVLNWDDSITDSIRGIATGYATVVGGVLSN